MAEPDWGKVLEYLEPKKPQYCPEEASLTQKVFLRTYALEAFFGGAAGGGKAVSVDTPIPTPEGFKPIKDIHPGDEIFGLDGKPYYVLAESEIHKKPTYRLTFDDGSSVAAADDHEWLTYDAKDMERLTKGTDEYRATRRATRESRATMSQGPRKSLAVAERNRVESAKNIKPQPTGSIRTTQEIVDTLTVRGGRANHAIPVAAAIQTPHVDLPIDPYTLGAWLGDGYSSAGSICGEDPEIWDECPYAIKSVRHPITDNANYAIVLFDGLRTLLRTNNLLNNKHIPHAYLWASEEQRVAILQGLMDTDGNVNGASVEFVNTNKNLVEGVAHLARSLGMKVNVREGQSTLYGIVKGLKWTVKFAANRTVFKLARKANTQKIAARRTNRFRYIKGVELLGDTNVKCIKVSSPDNLFLCDEHFIPTHNSSALLMAALQYVDVPGYSAILFRRTYADLALPGAIMDRFQSWLANEEDVRWNANNYTATFPSGARITFGYLNNVNDYLRYKGSEFQFIGVDEVTEIRESDYRYLFSRLRRPASGPLAKVPLRMRAASNPAPNWVRQRFIVEGMAAGRIFVPSKLTDNPGIDAESYRQSLSELDPVERRRLEEGDWWSTTLGSLFERESIVLLDPHEVPEITSAARAVRFWDLAASEPSPSYPDPDWTVGTLMLFDKGIAHILDVQRARVKGEKVEQLIAQTAYEDGHAVAIRMEQEPGSAGKALVDQYARYVLSGFDFGGIRSTGDKLTRARPFAAAVANGNVRCVRSVWLTDWLDELSSFPEAANHDDQVDSAVGAFTFLTGLGLPQRKRIAIVV